MTDNTWVVVLITAAALLPAILLGVVYLGARLSAHPRYQAARRAVAAFLAAHPHTLPSLAVVLLVPALVHYVLVANWLMTGIMALQLAGIIGQARVAAAAAGQQ